MSSSIAVYGPGNAAYGDVVLWVGDGETVNGVVTIHPTDNGLATGNSRFPEAIYGVYATGAIDTAGATFVPGTARKLITSDRKTVEINVVRGATLAILGPTLQFVPDGTTVSVLIVGR